MLADHYCICQVLLVSAVMIVMAMDSACCWMLSGRTVQAIQVLMCAKSCAVLMLSAPSASSPPVGIQFPSIQLCAARSVRVLR